MGNLLPKRHLRLVHHMRMRNRPSWREMVLMALVIPGALVSIRSPLSRFLGMEPHILLLLLRHLPTRCSHHTRDKQLQRTIIPLRQCQSKTTLPDHQGSPKRRISHRLWCSIRIPNIRNTPQHQPGLRRHRCLARRNSHHLRNKRRLLGTHTSSTQRLHPCQWMDNQFLSSSNQYNRSLRVLFNRTIIHHRRNMSRNSSHLRRRLCHMRIHPNHRPAPILLGRTFRRCLHQARTMHHLQRLDRLWKKA